MSFVIRKRVEPLSGRELGDRRDPPRWSSARQILDDRSQVP